MKAKTAKPSVPAKARARAQPAPRQNRTLDRQTRKVLAKHYRAKYGVK